MRGKGMVGLATGVLLMFSSLAHSALIASLQFKDPIGTVRPTESFEVWVTLTLAADSDPLLVDRNAGYPFGFPTSFIPSRSFGGAPFASYSSVSSYVFMSCEGSLPTDNCRSEIYELDYNFGENSFHRDLESGEMMPGESRDYLFGTFVPSGSAPLGEYVLFNIGYGFEFDGLDAHGNAVHQSVKLASSCANFSPSCAFTRTVVSDVPIPAAGVLFMSGLGLIGVARRAFRASAFRSPA